jgi:hypothetical protein
MNATSHLAPWLIVTTVALASCETATAPKPVPPETGFFVLVTTGVSASNRHVAGFNKRRDFAGNDFHTPFRVSGGVEHTLQVASGSTQAGALALNENGDVAGYDFTPWQLDRALKWLAGSDAPTDTVFYGARPADLNNHRDALFANIAAYSYAAERDSALFLWSMNGIETVSTYQIPGLAGHSTFGVAINDSREILGQESASGIVNAVILDRVARPAPKSSCAFTLSAFIGTYPIALNDSGAYVVRRGAQQCLISPGDSSVVFDFEVGEHGLNNNGWLIGARLDPSGDTVPVVSIRGAQAIPVDSLFASADDRMGWKLESFVGLNDNNEILAVGSKAGIKQFLILAPRAR